METDTIPPFPIPDRVSFAGQNIALITVVGNRDICKVYYWFSDWKRKSTSMFHENPCFPRYDSFVFRSRKLDILDDSNLLVLIPAKRRRRLFMQTTRNPIASTCRIYHLIECYV